MKRLLRACTSASACACALLLGIGSLLTPLPSRADTVASLLGNFTINQYCGLEVSDNRAAVHYVVVFGQLPALRELHAADADGDGVTTQAERDAHVGTLAPGFAQALELRVDGVRVPLEATHWVSSLPTEQGGFSLRIDVDFTAPIPVSGAAGGSHHVQFANQNYGGRMGWHEIAVAAVAPLQVYDSNAYGNSLTGGLSEALQSLPDSGPLDERDVSLDVATTPPAGATLLGARPGTAALKAASTVPLTPDSKESTRAGAFDSVWITRETRRLVAAISAPTLAPRVALLTLLGALFLGAVHALSPGHGKTIVGAYLIGSRGTPRHAVFLGLTVTITHTLGVFALGFATLYASRFIVPERLFPILSLLSAVMVLGMGLFLLVQRSAAARRSLRTGGNGDALVFYPVAPVSTGWPATAGSRAAGGSARHAADRRGQVFGLRSPAIFAAGHSPAPGDGTLHSHGGGPLHSHLPPGAGGENITWRSLLTLGISGGLVPCPSAMVLLLAAVALNKTAYGMLLVVAFSVGLAITLTIVGLAFLYARNRFKQPQSGARWPHLLPVLSAATITAVGLALSIAALKSFA